MSSLWEVEGGGKSRNKNIHVSCREVLYVVLRAEVGWDVVKTQNSVGAAASKMPGGIFFVRCVQDASW